MEDAKEQDLQLCLDIMVMRRFAWTWDQMNKDKKQLSPEDWAFLEAMDDLQNEDARRADT